MKYLVEINIATSTCFTLFYTHCRKLRGKKNKLIAFRLRIGSQSAALSHCFAVVIARKRWLKKQSEGSKNFPTVRLSTESTRSILIRHICEQKSAAARFQFVTLAHVCASENKNSMMEWTSPVESFGRIYSETNSNIWFNPFENQLMILKLVTDHDVLNLSLPVVRGCRTKIRSGKSQTQKLKHIRAWRTVLRVWVCVLS